MAWPVAGFTSAMHPQVSSGEGCERGYHVSSETILSACANAASVASWSPDSQW